jgi:hypothetical protein
MSMSMLFAMMCATVAAQTYSPIVTMNVTLPDGQAKELTSPESGLATVALKDGTEIGIRPTILDAQPWTRVVITFFKMPTAKHATEEIGSVEVKTGAAVVSSKTTPAFKIAVTKVAAPAATTS